MFIFNFLCARQFSSLKKFSSYGATLQPQVANAWIYCIDIITGFIYVCMAVYNAWDVMFLVLGSMDILCVGLCSYCIRRNFRGSLIFVVAFNNEN